MRLPSPIKFGLAVAAKAPNTVSSLASPRVPMRLVEGRAVNLFGQRGVKTRGEQWSLVAPSGCIGVSCGCYASEQVYLR